jgi:hypothetical protein
VVLAFGLALATASQVGAADGQTSLTIAGGPASATDPTPVTIDADLYLPAVTPAPAVVLAHGFGGSKLSSRDDALYLAERGFVLLVDPSGALVSHAARDTTQPGDALTGGVTWTIKRKTADKEVLLLAGAQLGSEHRLFQFLRQTQTVLPGFKNTVVDGAGDTWIIEHIERHHKTDCPSLIKWTEYARKLWPEAFHGKGKP